MQIIPFVADSAADAVAKIRAELGPEAVVVNVRQLAPDGLARLWKKPRIEVLAYRPESLQPVAAPDELSALREEVRSLKDKIPASSLKEIRSAADLTPAPPLAASLPPGVASASVIAASVPSARAGQSPVASRTAPPAEARSAGLPGWRVGQVLENTGLLPMHAQRVVDQLRARYGEQPPSSLAEEILLARGALASFWPPLPVAVARDPRPHVLIGPAGVGKSTCLCKWLAQTVLIAGQGAHVWRLDGATANAAESLSVYSEILGVAIDRTWSAAEPHLDAEVRLVDLPGVDWRSPASIRELGRQLDDIGPLRVHLVLNAAYETTWLLAQTRAFAELPVEDLILTHLDEETRWGKIWNIVLGTNLPVRFLSATQNVPGEFSAATVDKILCRQFPA